MYLVTDEAKGVWDASPKKIEEPEFFSAFLSELLPDDQARRFCYWLSVALQSLRRSDFRPGQVLVLAGPPECGKSLLQYWHHPELESELCATGQNGNYFTANAQRAYTKDDGKTWEHTDSFSRDDLPTVALLFQSAWAWINRREQDDKKG